MLIVGLLLGQGWMAVLRLPAFSDREDAAGAATSKDRLRSGIWPVSRLISNTEVSADADVRSVQTTTLVLEVLTGTVLHARQDSKHARLHDLRFGCMTGDVPLACLLQHPARCRIIDVLLVVLQLDEEAVAFRLNGEKLILESDLVEDGLQFSLVQTFLLTITVDQFGQHPVVRDLEAFVSSSHLIDDRDQL